MAMGSFSAGLSGLSANSVYLNVIGNNLANITTIGFKASAGQGFFVVNSPNGATAYTRVGNLQRATPPVLADWVLGETPIGAHA